MDISINVGYFGPHISEDKDLIKKLDDIGVSCVWTAEAYGCLLYTSPSPRDSCASRMPSSA